MGLMTITLTECEARDAAADVAFAVRQFAACALVDDITAALDLPADLVWSALARIPDEMQPLLDSPEGWAALATRVADTLGVPIAYAPGVH